MKKIFSVIGEILMWIVIVLAFSALGFGSDNPARSMLIWIIFAIIIFAAGFVIAKKSKRRTVTTKFQIIFKRVFGLFLVLFGCLLPNLVFGNANFAFWIQVLIFIFALLIVATSIFAISLINKYLAGKKGILFSVLGYFLLIIAAFLPALAMSFYDCSYDALGLVYYILIGLSIFSWIGISLFSENKLA
ncbi:MAG: hypothetical protein H8E33_00250 [Candidatus Cloacimonetes bacterium]|nr:hypothetical protein [Candidatus Cloacimonadota bacterium]